jgi:hypothetical protein
MKTLARALINAAAFLELSGEQALDPGASVQALEEIAYTLSHCTPEEKGTLAEVLAEMRAAELETGPRPEVLEFLDTFLVAFGLEKGEEEDGSEDSPRLNLL